MNERYTWRGGSEELLRHGEESPMTLLFLPAMFEEANRMRRFTVSLMRGLAARGIGTILPDLPGTGESLTDLGDVTLDDWRDAVAALDEMLREKSGCCLSVAIRGGAILDRGSDHGWRLAPESGERLLRDLVRATALSSRTSATAIDRAAREGPILLAGQIVSSILYEELLLAPMLTANRRTVRLQSDAGPRDVSTDGSPLWRNAEPGDDPDMVAVMVKEISDWANTCASL